MEILMHDETIAIHAGYETDPTTRAVAVPIYQTVAYEFDNRLWMRLRNAVLRWKAEWQGWG
jgi:O-acetylhomoserine/O-acetylserine sulfhydrylase-like pyridoxal-dependent enzyme